MNPNQNKFQWAVVGAGPAGIAAVGKLLDHGIPPAQILWCDPYFKVGDLGMYWSTVSSNTKVKLFSDFLNNCASFAYQDVAQQFALNSLNPEDTCTLRYVVEPLQWVTDKLIKQVESRATKINSMALSERLWVLNNESQSYLAQNVILATGALPLNLNYAGVDVIPFDIAINKEQLKKTIDVNKVYAVFGSSHSAIIIIRYLVEMNVKKVINFYRSPCRYALNMGNWTLFDNTGLKGETAVWARENIDGVLPENVRRYNSTESNIARHLPECDRVIYAVGFEKRASIAIGDYEDTKYNPYVGIIAPGLFGFGIGYPELKSDPFGNVESQVGMWKFMTYINKVMPIWLQYHT